MGAVAPYCSGDGHTRLAAAPLPSAKLRQCSNDTVSSGRRRIRSVRRGENQHRSCMLMHFQNVGIVSRGHAQKFDIVNLPRVHTVASARRRC